MRTVPKRAPTRAVLVRLFRQVGVLSLERRKGTLGVAGGTVPHAAARTAHTERWTGDLRQFRVQTWREEGTDVAAVVLTRGGEVGLWMNLAHCRGEVGHLVWLWARFAAKRRPPLDVLTVHDLLILHPASS